MKKMTDLTLAIVSNDGENRFVIALQCISGIYQPGMID
jgi:hypothetical protein